MAYKTLLFGIDDMFAELKPFYDAQIQRGNLEIVTYAVFENNNVRLIPFNGQTENFNVDIAIISSRNDFYNRMKLLAALKLPRNRIRFGQYPSCLKVTAVNYAKKFSGG